jgi:RimJ/RimL family protein N-acetyltransferase
MTSSIAATAQIETARLVVRPFALSDLTEFVTYRQDPEVARYQGWEPGYTLADAHRLLASHGSWTQLALLDRESGRLHGDCAVRLPTEQPRTAELGITLATSSQGQGLATEALQAIVDRLFRTDGLHRVFAKVDDRNEPVHRLFERLGFRCEARLVDADWFKETWSTLRIYALLHSDTTPERARA